MNTIMVLDQALCVRIAESLLHFVWQGLLISLLLLVAGILMKRRSALLRYWLYVGGLGVMAFCPPVTFVMIGKIAAGPEPLPVAQRPALEPRVTADITASPPAAMHEPDAIQTEVQAPPNEKVQQASKPTHFWRTGIQWRRHASQIVFLYWIGVALMLARLLLALHGGQSLRQQAKLIEDENIQASLIRAVALIQLQATPMVVWCRRVAVPTVVGVIKPTILLPLSLAGGMSPEQVEILLLHELAHLRRHDHWVNLAQWVIESVLFFHPAVWWLSRRIRVERELCCDDMVLACGVQGNSYADSLLKMAELTRKPWAGRELPAFSLGVDGRQSNFGDRVLRLIEGTSHEALRVTRVWPVLAGAAILLAAAVVPWIRAKAGESSTADKDAGRPRIAPWTLFKQTDVGPMLGPLIVRLAKAQDPALKEPEAKERDTNLASSRTIHFPKDHAIGRVAIRGSNLNLEKLYFEGWQSLGPAQGEVKIATGNDVQLEINDATIDSLAELEKLGPADIQCLSVRSEKLTDADLAHLQRWTGLRELVLWGNWNQKSTLTGEGLSHLSGNKQLNLVMLQNSSLDEAGMKVLARLNSIRKLLLWNNWNLPASALIHLAALKNLERLTFNGTPVADEGMEQVKHLTWLKSLDLELTKVTDAGLRSINAMPNLESLYLPPATTDAGIKQLAGHPGLKSLGIRDIKAVTDDAIPHLENLPALESLALGYRNVTDKGLDSLKQLPKLKRLDLPLWEKNITDAGLEHLRSIPIISTLSLRGTAVSDKGLESLENQTSLECLNLERTKITNDGLKHLKNMHKLEILELSNTAVTDAGLSHLAGLKSLKKLTLDQTQVSGKGLAALRDLNALGELFLSNTHVDDAGLAHLAGLPVLHRLYLNGTKVTDAGLESLEQLSRLDQLSLVNTEVTGKGIANLKGLPSITSLYLTEKLFTRTDIEKFKQSHPLCMVNLLKPSPPRQAEAAANAPKVAEAAPQKESKAQTPAPDAQKLRQVE